MTIADLIYLTANGSTAGQVPVDDVRLVPMEQGGCHYHGALDQESRPIWMSKEDFEYNQGIVRPRHSSSDHNSVSMLRAFNRKKQLEQDVWKKLIEISALNLQEPSGKQRTAEIDKIKDDLFEKLESTPLIRNTPGPVGDFPLHACFLLHLEEIGKEIVDKFYSFPHGGEMNINIPYSSDLDVWRNLAVLRTDDPYDDGGLYTGETILHISIVQVSMIDRSCPEFIPGLMLAHLRTHSCARAQAQGLPLCVARWYSGQVTEVPK